MKRTFDLLVAGLGVAVLWPVMVAVACAVLLTDGRPVLFRQRRVGRHAVPFTILKFRTMRPSDSDAGREVTVDGDARITRLGRFLRDSKLDELPQLINVLRGEMSVVGPRPETPRYVDQYTSTQREVLQLKPGITDVASLRYRHESRILAEHPNPEQHYVAHIVPEKIRMNLAYARRATPLSDLAVVLRTGWRLFV